MNHFVHCCSFSTSNKILQKGVKSASQTCDFDARNAKFFWGGGTAPTPHPTPLGASILTPPILKFCLRYCSGSFKVVKTGTIESSYATVCRVFYRYCLTSTLTIGSWAGTVQCSRLINAVVFSWGRSTTPSRRKWWHWGSSHRVKIWEFTAWKNNCNHCSRLLLNLTRSMWKASGDR